MTSASVLIGNSIKKLTVILKKAGNPTGTITVLVRKGTGDSVGITFGTIAAANLTTTDQTFTLEAPTSHIFAANDKVLVEWDGTSSWRTRVTLQKRTDEVFDAGDTDFEFHTAIEATEDIIGVTRTNEDVICCRAIT